MREITVEEKERKRKREREREIERERSPLLHKRIERYTSSSRTVTIPWPGEEK